MSEDFNFGEFLDQFGEDPANLDDSGVGFDTFDYGRRDDYGAYANAQYVAEVPYNRDYQGDGSSFLPCSYVN